MQIERAIHELGLALPEPLFLPPGEQIPIAMVRVSGNHVYISGHGPTNPDGTVATWRGKVGREISVEQACVAARSAACAMLGSLAREIDNLDRVTRWLVIRGIVNATPEFTQHATVINAVSHLIHDLYGFDIGQHARVSLGVASLPLNVPVILEAELEFL